MYLMQMLLILVSETLAWRLNDRTYDPTERYARWIRIRIECKADKIKSINAEPVFRFFDVNDKTDL